VSVLEVRRVTKRFGSLVALNDVEFTLSEHEILGIIGPNGAGKSTLFNVIAGLEPVDSGDVFFEEKNLASMDDDALTLLRRDNFGFVFQAFHVLPQLSVEQNVALPLLLRKIDSNARAKAAIAAVKPGIPYRTMNEITIPATIGTHWLLLKKEAGSETVTVCELAAAPKARPPAVGRTTVWTTSLMWSTTGILSATNSMASSTTRIPSTHSFSSHAQGPGRVIRLVNRPNRPIMRSGI